jgi:DNA mismatch repair ATPase MutS
MAARLPRAWTRSWTSCATISTTGRRQIAAIEERERQRTGINSLKVRYNSVFGYYIEITKANQALAPADYERKQTLVNAERFTTPELKEYERKILTAHDRSIEIEKRILRSCAVPYCKPPAGSSERSAAVAEADLLANFAHLAAGRRYAEAAARGRAGDGGGCRTPSGDRAMDGGDARREGSLPTTCI